MKTKKLFFSIIITCLATAYTYAQVGINTTTPKDGSLLDIESTEKGIFIPKVNIANLSTIAPITGIAATVPALAAAEGLLVYNTNAATGEGYYYWSGTQWIALAPVEDGDFHQEGTSSAPTAITQDVFRTGNVAIGKTTANYPLDIQDLSSTRALNISTTAATTGVIYGIFVNNQNTAATTSTRYGMYTRVRVPAGQSNQAYGTYNELTGAGGTGNQTGTFNRMIGNEDRNITGVNNYFTAAGDGAHIGTNNNIASTGSGTHTGTQNQMRGSGTVRGVYNTFNSSAGNGTNRGVSNSFTNNGSGTQQGVYTSISGSGTGTHIGVSNFISSSGNNNHSGVVNTLTGTGNGEHVGVYNNINNSTGNNWGFRNEIDNTANGMTSYGTYNALIGSDVGGTAIAGYFSSIGAGTNYAAVFANGNVGIGTATPGYLLDVAGDINLTGTLRNSGGAYAYPDYVFETYFDGNSEFNKNYKLLKLHEVEAFLEQNKHLPNIQSRADVMANGWNVTEGIRDNLEKVEELFLHTIEASKKISKLQVENKTLKDKLDKTTSALEALSKRLEAIENK